MDAESSNMCDPLVIEFEYQESTEKYLELINRIPLAIAFILAPIIVPRIGK